MRAQLEAGLIRGLGQRTSRDLSTIHRDSHPSGGRESVESYTSHSIDRHRQSAKGVFKGTEGPRTEPENRKKTENTDLDLGQSSKGGIGVPVQADHDGEENQGDDRHCKGEEVGDIYMHTEIHQNKKIY